MQDTLCRVCGQERDASEIVKIDAKDGEVGFQLWCPKREGIHDHQFAPPLKHLDIPQRSAQETHDLQQVGAAVVDDALRSTEATLETTEHTVAWYIMELRHRNAVIGVAKQYLIDGESERALAILRQVGNGIGNPDAAKAPENMALITVEEYNREGEPW